MLNTFTKTAAALGLAATLAACGSLDGGPLVRPGEPVGQITIRNLSSAHLTAVTMSDCSNSTYGFNRLGDGETIPPGYDRRFTVSTGCWDVQVGYGYGTGYAYGSKRTQIYPGRNQILTYGGE